MAVTTVYGVGNQIPIDSGIVGMLTNPKEIFVKGVDANMMVLMAANGYGLGIIKYDHLD